MNTLTRIAASSLAKQPLTIRLRANKTGTPVEVDGAGYAPQTVQGEIDGDKITYPTAVFSFSGPLGWIYGWYATIGDEVIEGGLFANPFFVGGKGFKIRIPLSVETQ